ncbi:MAG: chloride channel protein, partial [Cyanobacteria bacterium J06607_15]
MDERNVSGTNSNSDSAGLNQLNYFQLYLCAVVIGIFGGMVATAYYFVLEAMMHGMWHSLPEILKPLFPSWLP